MTPLDRLIKLFPVLGDVLPWLGDHLPLLVGAPVAFGILLGFFWVGFIAPRRAKRVLQGLVARGYSPLRQDDPQLLSAVRLLTPLVYTTYEEAAVKERGPWRVERALAGSSSGRTRFIAHLSRVVSVSTPQVSRTDRDFSVVCLEAGRLPVGMELHVVGDGHRLDPAHGVQKVEAGLEAPLVALFDFYAGDAARAVVPAALQQALLECSPFLSLQGSRKKSESYLFHARLKFTPEGWGLISDEFVSDRKKMDALVNAADRISRALF